MLQERFLTETDGPFVSFRSRPAIPSDTNHVVVHVAKLWGSSLEDVRALILKNLMRILAH
jgi:Tat protein secretion system quality control protein TatD with DNase activity